MSEELKPKPTCIFCGSDDMTDFLRFKTYSSTCNECEMTVNSKSKPLRDVYFTRPIEDELRARVKELEALVAKMLAKDDTLKCYMCNGGKYFEWVDWDTFDEEHKTKYINEAKEKCKK